MNADEARRRLVASAVARLATVTASGQPHVVPICFAVAGDTIYNAVDEKPKRSPRLQRIANVTAGGAGARASVLVDEWSDDWTQLWWVRADGSARVVPATEGGSSDDSDGEERAAAHELLRAKYPQYASHRLGDVVAVDIDRLTAWAAR